MQTFDTANIKALSNVHPNTFLIVLVSICLVFLYYYLYLYILHTYWSPNGHRNYTMPPSTGNRTMTPWQEWRFLAPSEPTKVDSSKVWYHSMRLSQARLKGTPVIQSIIWLAIFPSILFSMVSGDFWDQATNTLKLPAVPAIHKQPSTPFNPVTFWATWILPFHLF